MATTRTVYRCAYHHQVNLRPARETRSFKTEAEARAEAEKLRAAGHMVAVWRYHEVKNGRRWEVDLHHDLTQPLGP